MSTTEYKPIDETGGMRQCIRCEVPRPLSDYNAEHQTTCVRCMNTYRSGFAAGEDRGERRAYEFVCKSLDEVWNV